MNRKPPARLIITILLAAASTAVASVNPAAGTGTGPTLWVQSSYDDFRGGDLVSVSLDDQGEIRLAPRLAVLGDAREAYVWAVDEAPDGSVFAAAGTEGRRRNPRRSCFSKPEAPCTR